MDTAGKFIRDAVSAQPDQTILLLSGGSAVAAYTAVADAVLREELPSLAIGQIDERYGEPGHDDSNELAIEQSTGLVSASQAISTPYFSMLNHGGPMTELADRYDEILRMEMKKRQVMAVLGIGPDGHTAGILPMDGEKFDEVFQPGRLVVGYEAPGPYPRRITVTPNLLLHCSTVIVVVAGEQKTVALRDSFISPDVPVHKTPAVLLRRCRNVHVFSDIEIKPGG